MTGEESTDDGAVDDAGVSKAKEATAAAGEPEGIRARAWRIAADLGTPADYGIPPLPEWTVYKEAGGGMALGAEDGDGVFVAADDPVDVRR